MDDAPTIPTWDYQPDGSAKIFDLALGENLPDGWSTSPSVITDPALATGEALTARLQGREYVPPVSDTDEDVPGQTGATGGEALALAEIERLNGIIASGTAENADLVAQIEGAEAALDAAAGEVATLRAALAAAGDEKSAALAAIEALTADLAKAKADLDEVLAAPAEAALDAKGK